MSAHPEKTPEENIPAVDSENTAPEASIIPANSNVSPEADVKTGAEDEKKEAPKKPPPTVEELQEQIRDMSGEIVRARRETRKIEKTVQTKETEITDLRRINATLETKVEESKRQGFEKFAFELLSVADNLERALSHLPEGKLNDMEVNALATGVSLTARQLTAIFNKFGIQKIDAQDKEFDPAIHQAVRLIEKDGLESGHVADVMQSGYTINGKLLRVARVSVTP